MGAFRRQVVLPALHEKVVVSFDDDVLQAELLQRYGSKNTETVQLVALSWVTLLTDSPCDSQKPSRLFRKFVSNLLHDYLGQVGFLASLADSLVASLRLDAQGQPLMTDFDSNFKRTPVFKEYLCYYRTRDPRILRWLLTFLWFGKKSPFKDPMFESTALRGWLEVESGMRESFSEGLVYNLKTIIGYLMESYNRDEFLPKHGPGAVAEPKLWGVSRKTLVLEFSPIQQRVLVGLNRILHENSSYGAPFPMSIPVGKGSKRPSRIKFVPKNYKTARTICMEPTVNMFIQQAVRRWVERSISDGLLRERVTLKRQQKNQSAACIGSKTGLVDTIDLKAASDSVAWKLIKQIFPTSILIDFYASRSSKVKLPGGTILTPKKFAPMGSALCFPVQSILFAATTIVASLAFLYRQDVDQPLRESGKILRHTIEQLCASESYHGTALAGLCPFQIYGDDITCDVRVTSNIVRALSALGFSVNTSKSFTGSQAFRESCGEYYVAGETVTPCFMTFKAWEGSQISADGLVSVIALANKALSHGLHHLNSFLVKFCLHYPIQGRARDSIRKNRLVFVFEPDGPFELASLNPFNPHLKTATDNIINKPPWGSELSEGQEGPVWKCYKPSYQRVYYSSYALRPLEREPYVDDPRIEGLRYTLWWRSRLGRRGVGLIEAVTSKVDARGSRIVPGWTPVR